MRHKEPGWGKTRSLTLGTEQKRGGGNEELREGTVGERERAPEYNEGKRQTGSRELKIKGGNENFCNWKEEVQGVRN